ncbi:uncharacterized protein LOC106091380 [Stomoxys calcitrans]|uniref:uncharacterized protein LOC106091380 n=1 Tax=Stomoxys calcitrans TaxID=35570 RepID=UPI0027E31971|nr:uncharacterized protein LOC106091380 [Stomoxys calcitrans]
MNKIMDSSKIVVPEVADQANDRNWLEKNFTPSPAKCSSLLDLNDDCLLEVLQYITVRDAFTLLETFANRLHDVVHKRISQLKILTFDLRNAPDFTIEQLQIIGKHLKTLNICVGYSLSSDLCIFRYLKPLCYYGSIEQMTLNYVNFNEAYQQCILNLAANLRFLDLSFCQLTDELLEPILENCMLLEKLSIIGNYEWRGKSLFSIKSPKIGQITIELNDLCEEQVETFARHIGESICLIIFNKGRSNHHKGHFR